VNGGHPDVKAHNEIANVLVAAIDGIDAWTPFNETIPPRFVSLPDTPLVATSNPFSITVKTDRYATVRYSTENKPFNQMEHTFTATGTRTHSVSLPCEQNQQYTYYVRALDAYGNDVDSAAVIHFAVDTTKMMLSWKAIGYDLSAWKTGTAPLGNDPSGLHNTQLDSARTAYFRHSLSVQNVSSILDLTAFIKGHDGVVAYLNGQEYARINIDPGTDVAYSTHALKPLTYSSTIALSATNGLNFLREGENVFTFEVHSRDTLKPDVSFDAAIFNASNTIYYDLGSDWSYYDRGTTPANQYVDKPVSGVFAENRRVVPQSVFLYPNFPNPFNPSTTISFDLNKRSQVELKMFNLLGQEVKTLVSEELVPGTYAYRFDAGNLASGVYVCRLRTETTVNLRKMILMK
jgi:hypothetical protein